MNHKPNRLDIVTDLRRSISASFSNQGFNDINSIVFRKKAEEKLKTMRTSIDNSYYLEAIKRIRKAEDPKNPIEKRREDLLTASSILRP